MKHLTPILSAIAAGSLLASCAMGNNDENNAGQDQERIEQEETESSPENSEEESDITEQEENTETSEPEEDTETTPENAEKESDAAEQEENADSTYTNETVDGSYSVKADVLNIAENNRLVIGFSFDRTDEEKPLGTRLMDSLTASDVTSNQVLSELQEVRIVRETEAELRFTEDHQLTSMASTEHLHLDTILHEISHFYGISSLHFFVEDQPGILYGQTGEIKTMPVEAEENRGYYLASTEVNKNEEAVYFSGYTLDEKIRDEEGELLDFAETVDAMASIESDASGYESAIPETIQIQDVQIEGEEGTIVFDMDNNQIDKDRMLEHFRTALQLTALDFNLTALHLENESDMTRTSFIFDRPTVAEEKSQSEEAISYSGEKTSYLNGRFGYYIQYPKEWNEGDEADNGDGKILHDIENNDVDIRVFGRHHMNESTPDPKEYDSITIADGEEAYFLETMDNDRYTFEVFKVNDDVEHLITGDVPMAFYEKNKEVIDELIRSFDTAN